MTATATDLPAVVASAAFTIGDERRNLVAASRELPERSEALDAAIRSLANAMAELGAVREMDDGYE